MNTTARSKSKLLFTLLIGLALASIFLAGCSAESQWSAPGLTLTVEPAGQPKQVSSGVQLLILITILSLAPSLLVMTTSFARIIIVLSLLRNAIGTPQIPPNQVLVGLALILTFFIMSPVYGQIDQQALKPYMAGQIDQSTAFKNAMAPLREFMFKQTRQKDLELFLEMNHQERPNTLDDIPTDRKSVV